MTSYLPKEESQVVSRTTRRDHVRLLLLHSTLSIQLATCPSHPAPLHTQLQDHEEGGGRSHIKICAYILPLAGPQSLATLIPETIIIINVRAEYWYNNSTIAIF